MVFGCKFGRIGNQNDIFMQLPIMSCDGQVAMDGNLCVCVCVLENLEQGGTWHYCHCMMNVVDVCWDGFCWVVICSTCKIWELMHAIKS